MGIQSVSVGKIINELWKLILYVVFSVINSIFSVGESIAGLKFF